MSGKSDVVDGGIVEGYGARALRPHDRKRHGRARLLSLGLQHLLDALQDEGARRAAFAGGPRLQAAVHRVGNIDRRTHAVIVPYLWLDVADDAVLSLSRRPWRIG